MLAVPESQLNIQFVLNWVKGISYLSALGIASARRFSLQAMTDIKTWNKIPSLIMMSTRRHVIRIKISKNVGVCLPTTTKGSTGCCFDSVHPMSSSTVCIGWMLHCAARFSISSAISTLSALYYFLLSDIGRTDSKQCPVLPFAGCGVYKPLNLNGNRHLVCLSGPSSSVRQSIFLN